MSIYSYPSTYLFYDDKLLPAIEKMQIAEVITHMPHQ